MSDNEKNVDSDKNREVIMSNFTLKQDIHYTDSHQNDDTHGTQSIESLIEGAKSGHMRYQCNLASKYYLGEGIGQSYEKAAEWSEKAAEQGHAIAQYDLGVIYYAGKGVKQDYRKAFEWFKKAAEQGDAVAQSFLGIMYYKGQGVGQDYKNSAESYHKAFEGLKKVLTEKGHKAAVDILEEL